MMYAEVLKELEVYGDRVNYARRKKLINQTEFGHMIHSSQNIVSQIERGHYLPDPTMIEEISEVLGVDW